MLIVDTMYTVSRSVRPRCVFACVTVTFITLIIIENMIEYSQQSSREAAFTPFDMDDSLPLMSAVTQNGTSNPMIQMVARLSLLMEKVNSKLTNVGIDQSVLRSVFVNTGSHTRLEVALVDALVNKRTFKIGVLGASVSAGACIQNTKAIYVNVFAQMMSEQLGIPVELHNGAIGGCDGQYYSYCAHTHLDMANMDLILMEFAINDQGPVAMWQERLLRKLLSLPQRPQLVYVNYILGKWLEEGRGNAEADEITPLSRHYEVPSLSFLELVKHEKMTSVAKLFFCPSDDYNHPSIKGHEIMAIFLLQLAATSVVKVARYLNEHERVDIDALRKLNQGPQPDPLWAKAGDYWETRCWSSQRPLSKPSEGGLTPVYNDGWTFQVPKESSQRNDVKSTWMTKSPGKTIVFAAPVLPTRRDLECNVTLVTLTCPTCGKAQMHLDTDRDTMSPVVSSGMYRLPRYNHMPYVSGQNHTLTVQSISDEQVLIAGLVVFCVPCSLYCPRDSPTSTQDSN